MRKAAWIPTLSFGTCLVAMLAVGVRAQAAGGTACVGPGPLDEAGSPGVAGWGGPPAVDGSLDDGALPGYAEGGTIREMLGAGTALSLPTPFSYTTLTAPYADMTGCMAGPNDQGHKASHDCLCKSCFTLMQQCDAVPGCQAIWKCVEDSGCINMTSSCAAVDAFAPSLGCTETTTCYFAPGAACAATIDQWGNAGVPTALQGLLFQCAATNMCPVQ